MKYLLILLLMGCSTRLKEDKSFKVTGFNSVSNSTFCQYHFSIKSGARIAEYYYIIDKCGVYKIGDTVFQRRMNDG